MQKQRFLLIALLAAASPALAAAPGVGDANVSVLKEAPTRFYGLALDYSFWDGTSLNAQNYSNTFSQLFLPAWNFGKIWFKGTRFERASLGGRFVLDRMLTGYDDSSVAASNDHGMPQPCSNLTTSTNGGVVDPTQVQRCPYSNDYRWHPSDITMILKNPKIVTIPYAGININPALSLILPTSLESRYQTLRAAPGASLGFSRSFFNDKLTVGYSLWFTKYFQASQQAQIQNNGSAGTVGNGQVSPGYDASQLSVGDFYANPDVLVTQGVLNPNYSFRHTFAIDILPTEKLSISVLYILIDAFEYGVDCTPTNVPNVGMVDTCANGDAVAGNSGSQVLRNGHKDQQVFWLTIGYDVLDWLNVNIAWINWAPQRKPDGSLRQPFISTDYDAYTSISLGATISLDKAAAKIF